MSEHQATHALRKAFHEADAHNYFHVPVALFGERSSYPGDFGAFEALSTDRVLAEGDTIILDAAPIFDGYTVDTSHAVNIGNSAVFEELDRHLPVLRDLIKNRINESGTFQKIAWEVDDYIRSHGYENCHRFEEILIVDEDGARWLAEDLPHHRRWSAYDTAKVSEPLQQTGA